jgi:hypothetical protein
MRYPKEEADRIGRRIVGIVGLALTLLAWRLTPPTYTGAAVLAGLYILLVVTANRARKMISQRISTVVLCGGKTTHWVPHDVGTCPHCGSPVK